MAEWGMTKRSDKVEVQRRVLQLVELIAAGHNHSAMVQFATDAWGIKTRQAEAYVQKARAIVVEDINQDRKQVLAEAIATCRMVIRDASKAGQYNNVIGAVNALSRLGKLDA